LLAVLKLEKGAEFEEALKRLEEAKEKCLSTPKPDSECHNKSQEALKKTATIYDKILEEYRKRLPTRPAPRL
jgi:thymidylate kinase